MSEWLNRNVEGSGIIFVLMILFILTIFSIGVTEEKKAEKLRIESGVVHIDGYIHVNNLKYIIKESN